MYTAPVIDSSGLHINQYADIMAYYKSAFQSIFGADAYLGEDSKDYQLMSIVALSAADANQALQLAYNNMQPQNAIGAAQDGLYKLNGITREAPSYSMCEVTLTGTAGTAITAGIVGDVNGKNWNLPSSVTIGAGGTSTVTAVCQDLGAITALIGDISSIVTPTAGWISVTNSVAATPGQPVETDSAFRARQAISVELPSKTLLAGTVAAIAAASGVTRYNVLQNVGSSVDSNGLEGHSIWAVVEGGNDATIAGLIQANKGPGCGTNGTSSEIITDPISNITETILFSRPTYVDIFVVATAHLLTGGTSATLATIKAAIVAYLNSLQIGEIVTLSALYAVAMNVMANLKAPIASIRSLTITTKGVATTGTLSGGTGYAAATGVPCTGGTGHDCTVDITVDGSGVIQTVTVHDPGSDFTVADVMTIVQGTNTTATFHVATIVAAGTSDIAVSFDHVARGNTNNTSVTSV